MPDFNFLEDEEDRVPGKTPPPRIPFYPEPVDIGPSLRERTTDSIPEATRQNGDSRTSVPGEGEISPPHAVKGTASQGQGTKAKKADDDGIPVSDSPRQAWEEARTGKNHALIQDGNGLPSARAAGIVQGDTLTGCFDAMTNDSTNPEGLPGVQHEMPKGDESGNRKQHTAGHGFPTVFLSVLAFLFACTILAVLLDLHEPVIRFARSLLGEHAEAESPRSVPRGSAGLPTVNTSAKETAVEQGGRPAAERDWDYYVQVASKPRYPEAQKIANALRRAGIPAVTDIEYIPRYKRPWYRIKVGPFASAAEALSMRDSLRTRWRDAFIDSARYEPATRNEQTSRILQPEIGGASPKTQTAKRPVPRGFAVRVGSFPSRTPAEQELARVRAHGYPAWVETARLPEGIWYRVHVGPFTSREEAERYVRAVRSAISPEAFIVNLDARTP
ncbi:MAG: SPOR domain-containing protein [Bacteroidota bacterium]|nr:SPOR domain-containing protein [Bacteroidota bacterium]